MRNACCIAFVWFVTYGAGKFFVIVTTVHVYLYVMFVFELFLALWAFEFIPSQVFSPYVDVHVAFETISFD